MGIVGIKISKPLIALIQSKEDFLPHLLEIVTAPEQGTGAV